MTIPQKQADPDQKMMEWVSGDGGSKIFGFASKAHLYDWFLPEERLNLYNMGYRIREYEVDEENVCFGYKQLAFGIPSGHVYNN